LIVHVVLFEPRGDLTEQEQRQVVADLQHAASSIPSIRSLRVGRRIRHGLPGYEQAMKVDYQYVALFEFDDHAALKAYLQHPAHEAAGRHFTVSAAHSLAYDFEL
jgi:stress responsive alpha/beta barrel protein